MAEVSTITTEELVRQIELKLKSMPYKPNYSHYNIAPDSILPAVYTLIIGAGFSHGVVPLVKELMHMCIGDYYYPDQDQSSLERGTDVSEENSANFWKQYNKLLILENQSALELDNKGLPKDAGQAYQELFNYKVANKLFKTPVTKPLSFNEKLSQNRIKKKPQKTVEVNNPGERFVKGFLRYILDPGCEAGYGSTGRSELNSAHKYLAALLEAQQLGRVWKTRAFCRTIFTTNFDTLLQNALQVMNLLYCITDRPEKGFSEAEFTEKEGAIHLVYTHGSILRHNPASTIYEIDSLKNSNAKVLHSYLQSHDVITIGYSGWSDGLMAALNSEPVCKNNIYWCGISPEPSEVVKKLLKKKPDNRFYVFLGKDGAQGLMKSIYETLVPDASRIDPMLRYKDWKNLVWKKF